MCSIHPNYTLFKAHFCSILKNRGVFVYIDAKKDIVVPKQFRKAIYLSLYLHRDACYVTDDVIVAHLIFDGEEHTCFIPLNAVFAYGRFDSQKAMNEILSESYWYNKAPSEIDKISDAIFPVF